MKNYGKSGVGVQNDKLKILFEIAKMEYCKEYSVSANDLTSLFSGDERDQSGSAISTSVEGQGIVYDILFCELSYVEVIEKRTLRLCFESITYASAD